MNRRRLMRLALAVFACSFSAGSGAQAHAGTACTPHAAPLYQVSGRVDSLAATNAGVVALLGSAAATIRFLPHDNVVAFTGTGRHSSAATITLPPYIAAPGLAADAGGARAYVLVDGTLLVLDTRTGRVIARWTLDMQAVGWPAAIAADNDHVYVVGQPTGAWAAQVEALMVRGAVPPRVLWRARLGLTHAGIWLGTTGSDDLAVFLPSAADVHGTVAILSRRTGALVRSYAVPAPPIAADPAHDRLFLADAGIIRALSLLQGHPIATTPGEPPLAVDPARGMVAFTRGGSLILADSNTLRTLSQLQLHDSTALAFTGDGALLIGAHGGITRLEGTVGAPGACRHP